MKSACVGMMMMVVLAVAMGAQARSLEGGEPANGRRLQQVLRGLIAQRLLDPNGFTVGAGIKLAAEVDDIETNLDLGPFEFKLDDIKEEKEEEKEEKEEKKDTKADAFKCPQERCDTASGFVFCCFGPHYCVPTGKVIDNCGH